MSQRFAGLDWASQTHAACVIDEHGRVVLQFEVKHDAAGLAELSRRWRAAGVTAVAIERPSGLIVDALLEAGFTVVPIHPNVVKATRPRYRSHGGKSDASDAYLLADLLRTDGHRFPPLAPQNDEIGALRALVRGRDDLIATCVQLANQLRSLLQSFWPGAAQVFAEVDSPIGLAFIQRYPTPESAHRLGPKRMTAFCAQHGYSGRRGADELLARLQQAPAVALGALEIDEPAPV
jgi:transposase